MGFLSQLYVFKFFYIVVKPYILSNDLEVLGQIEVALESLTSKAKQAQFIIVSGNADSRLIDIGKRMHIPTIDISSIHVDKQYHVSQKDSHLNGEGYKKVAKIVAAYMIEQKESFDFMLQK